MIGQTLSYWTSQNDVMAMVDYVELMYQSQCVDLQLLSLAIEQRKDCGTGNTLVEKSFFSRD